MRGLLAAVGVKFRHVLARVGARGKHQHGHALVNERIAVINAAKEHAVGFHRLFAGGTENRVKSSARAAAADAHDGYAAAPGRCGQRGDGVVFVE